MKKMMLILYPEKYTAIDHNQKAIFVANLDDEVILK